AARLREHQWRRLRALLDEIYAAPGNAYWRAAWARAGVSAPGDLKTWDDFQRLPLSRKSDVVEDQVAHPPFGSNLTYPLERYVRVHQTSGSTGAPLRWLDTQASWDWWTHCWRFVLAGAGLGPADRIYFPFSFGLFIGFWAGFEGARALGALAIPGGGADSPAREGELVLTNLGRLGSPVIRYRTGDRVRLADAPCACGRTFRRLEGGILGRLDDMLILRGVNVFPSAVEDIVRRFAAVEE